MIQPIHVALLLTVAMLVVTAYFLLGSVPLLVLKHDNPMDSRFIRSFYLTYFRMALVTALATSASFVMAGRSGFAAGAGAIALLIGVLRANFIPKMEVLAPQIQLQDATAIQAFRKIHKSAIALNLMQLLAILGSLSHF